MLRTFRPSHLSQLSSVVHLSKRSFNEIKYNEMIKKKIQKDDAINDALLNNVIRMSSKSISSMEKSYFQKPVDFEPCSN